MWTSELIGLLDASVRTVLLFLLECVRNPKRLEFFGLDGGLKEEVYLWHGMSLN